MRLTFKYIAVSIFFGSLLAIFYATPLQAQSKYSPTAVRVGTDVYGIGQTFIGDKRQRIELNGDLALSKYFIALDVGMDNLSLKKETFSYSNEGYYFRIGGDINFMPEDEDNNAIFFGARYARSFFKDNLIWRAENPNYAVPSHETSNANITGGWFELVGGMKVNVWKALYVGYTVRFKFIRSIKGDDVLIPYEMPGYGVYESKNRMGFNYQVSWRFPIKRANQQ